MNVLTSLKALLFSSAATAMPGDGAVAPVTIGEGASDFASLLSGTMEATTDAAAPVAAMPEIAEGNATPIETPTPLPLGLATALNAIQTHRKPSLPLPQGIARHVEDAQAAPVEGNPAALAEAATADPVVAQPSLPVEDAPEAVMAEPAKVRPEASAPKSPDLPKASHLEASAEAPVAHEPAITRNSDASDSKKDRDGKEDADGQSGDNLAMAAVPAPVPSAILAPIAQPAASAQAVPVLAALPEKQPAQDVTAAPLPEVPSIPQIVAPAAVQAPAADPETITSTSPALPEQPPAPAAKAQPVKSEALALLQLVRDQLAARQSGAPVRAAEAPPAAARPKAERAAPVSDAATALPPAISDAMPQSLPSQSAPAVAAQVMPAAPVADLSASLGTQVVDMGISGQWIDGLARDIAGLSANGAQGRFQINADQLGPVRVDIRQGTDGAAVSLTVASEAAEMALRQDSDRLRLDASLSAVRIAEVKIERAPHVAEAARADGANQQNAQQQSSQRQSDQPGSAWANNGQNLAQSQGQAQGQAQGQGRWQARENSAFAPKNSGDPAVLNHDDMRRTTHDSVRARYA